MFLQVHSLFGAVPRRDVSTISAEAWSGYKLATSVASLVPHPTLSAQTPDEGAALEGEVHLRDTAGLTPHVETNRASNSESLLKDL